MKITVSYKYYIKKFSYCLSPHPDDENVNWKRGNIKGRLAIVKCSQIVSPQYRRIKEFLSRYRFWYMAHDMPVKFICTVFKYFIYLHLLKHFFFLPNQRFSHGELNEEHTFVLSLFAAANAYATSAGTDALKNLPVK